MSERIETTKSLIMRVEGDKYMDFWVDCPEGEGWGMKAEQIDEMIQEYFDKHF